MSRTVSRPETPPSSAPGTVASTGPVAENVAGQVSRDDFQVDWAKVDAAMEHVAGFDVLELGSLVVDRAIAGGPQNVYNEAGAARFQVAKLKQQYEVLKANICGDSLDAKYARIAALEAVNAKKRLIAHTDTD